MDSSQMQNAENLADPQYVKEIVEEFYMYIFILFASLALIILWKKYHPKSHKYFEFFALWSFPPGLCISQDIFMFWKFLLVWCGFTIATLRIVYLLCRQSSQPTIPRKVYTWFLFMHKMSVALGLVGCGFFCLHFTVAFICGILGRPYDGQLLSSLAILSVYYGVYFGVLNKDSAHFCAEKMSHSGITYSGSSGTSLSSRQELSHCAICLAALSDQESGLPGEQQVRLSCKHKGHVYCLRGWTIVAKKSVCPVCGEKVDMKALCADEVWLKTSYTWARLIHLCRIFVVWNPTLFMFGGMIFRYLDRKLGFNHLN